MKSLFSNYCIFIVRCTVIVRIARVLYIFYIGIEHYCNAIVQYCIDIAHCCIGMVHYCMVSVFYFIVIVRYCCVQSFLDQYSVSNVFTLYTLANAQCSSSLERTHKHARTWFAISQLRFYSKRKYLSWQIRHLSPSLVLRFTTLRLGPRTPRGLLMGLLTDGGLGDGLTSCFPFFFAFFCMPSQE